MGKASAPGALINEAGKPFQPGASAASQAAGWQRSQMLRLVGLVR